MCKIQGLSLKNGVDIRTFVLSSAKITAWHRNYLVLVCTWWYSISGVKFDLILVLLSQFFEYLRETSHKHALEHLKAARPEKMGIFFSSYGKCPTMVDFFEGL